MVYFEIIGQTFHISQTIYESTRFTVYRAEQRSDSRRALLKVGAKDSLLGQAVAHEYAMLRSLDPSFVPEPLAVHTDDEEPWLAVVDDGMTVLADLLPEDGLAIEPFLRLALVIARALQSIHQADVIHRDVNPSNIIVSPDSGRAKLIDFELSSRMSGDRSGNSAGPQGTLAYTSPEQTGRIHRPVDFRSDCYSLGVTLYEMLTGSVPFPTRDPVELVHAHIALNPARPSSTGRSIPTIISDIVLRLLAKVPEQRYQTIDGLILDLQNCLEQLEHSDQIEPFPLAEDDHPSALRLSQKLYGRSEQIAKIYNAFEATAEGVPRVLFVRGDSGVGKSSLIQELRGPVAERNGIFAIGKFDQVQRNTPYTAISAAFTEVVRTIACRDLASRNRQIERLKNSLGVNAGIVCDMVPGLVELIGPCAATTRSTGPDARERFHYAFRSFVRALSGPESPLVLSIDDFQWGEPESLNLLQSIILDREIRHVLLIVSWREGEVGSKIDLHEFRSRLEKLSVPISDVPIGNLQLGDVQQLLADTLGTEPGFTIDLARILLGKTAGNAFFLRQFFHTLSERSLIRYDSDARRWRWDVAEIDQQDITENVEEMLREKLNKLPEDTSRALHYAACIGHRFKIHTLARVAGVPQQTTLETLSPAIVAGLVVLTGDNYRHPSPTIDSPFIFYHDSVQQAAYFLRSEDERRRTHAAIGRVLLESPDNGADSNETIEIAEQFTLGLPLIRDPEELLLIASQLLEAGKEAKIATAYGAAYSYLDRGIEAFSRAEATDQHGLWVNLYTEAAEAALLLGRPRDLDRLAGTVLAEEITLLEEARVKRLQIRGLIAQNRRKEGIVVALEMLARLGVHFNLSPPLLILWLRKKK